MSRDLDPRALEAFADALFGGVDGAIERQEAREQARACGGGGSGSTVSIARRMSPEERAALEAMGIVFLEANPGKDADPVLQKVQLPEGWKLQPTDHAMYSDLVDATGGKRASCGYKGAFYDRWSNIRLLTRYTTQTDYGDYPKDGGRSPTCVKAVDTKTGAVLFQTDMAVIGYEDHSQYEACAAYLDEHFPQWRDVSAYWDAT